MVRRARAEGTRVLLSDVHAQPMIALGRSSLAAELGEDAVLGGIDEALLRATEILATTPEAEERRAAGA